MNTNDMKQAIMTSPIGVVGLGYVGLTDAIMIASQGYDVLGLDVDKHRVDAINQGEWPLDPGEPTLPKLMHTSVKEDHLKATISYDKAVEACNVFIIAVPTPVYDNHNPNLEWLEAAVEGITTRATDAKLIIIASTVPPGTTRLLGLVSNAGSSVSERHLFAHAPERLSLGELAEKAETMTRIVGGVTDCATTVATHIYENFFPCCDVIPATAREAEIVKTAENAYRDLKIAFAHELLWLCDLWGESFWRVRNMINTSPGRDVPYASAGVGGHCLPKDGHLLWHGDYPWGGHLVREARYINEKQFGYLARCICGQLREAVSVEDDYKLLFCGVGYKADTKDSRNSPAMKISEYLHKLGYEVTFHDPYLPQLNDHEHLWRCAEGCDAIVFVQAHRAYHRIPWHLLRDEMRSLLAFDLTGLIESPPDDWTFWQLGNPNG